MAKQPKIINQIIIFGLGIELKHLKLSFQITTNVMVKKLRSSTSSSIASLNLFLMYFEYIRVLKQVKTCPLIINLKKKKKKEGNLIGEPNT